MRKKKKQGSLLVYAAAALVMIVIALGIWYIQNDAPGWPFHESSAPAEVLPEDSTFSIHFFDVGEGDAALVECDGRYMLIDGGLPDYSDFLYAYLEQHGIGHLDYIICSHAHIDHVGGLSGALNYATVGEAYCPVTSYDSRSFNSFVKYLARQGKEIKVPVPGDTIRLGSALITFIGPVDMTLAAEEENNISIILRIEYGETSFLFTGDAEAAEEESVTSSGQALQSTLLKVAHHGSFSSSTEQFLTAVKPRYAVISVGRDNEFDHPHNVCLRRLDRYCKEVYRTDTDGEIICRSDGHTLTFETAPKE
ncbi:MAG: MBL fold metallo-hydrolase [Firmicutes bacterium]|nr:MBL fold metallo-hydrolase [Bacillota bacterium]